MKEYDLTFSGWVATELKGGLEDRFWRVFSLRSEIKEFQSRLGYDFQNPSYLFEALCHRSFINEQALSFPSNERLEFLGDSLFSFMVAKELFNRYPEWDEGALSKMRDVLVNREVFGEVAKFLGCSQVVLIGKGSFLQGGRENLNLLGNTLESLATAILLDSSPTQCFKCFNQVFLRFDRDFYNQRKLVDFDAKSRLQELTLKRYKVTPRYSSREILGEGFEVELSICNRQFGPVKDASKKRGEKRLAEQVLKEVSNHVI